MPMKMNAVPPIMAAGFTAVMIATAALAASTYDEAAEIALPRAQLNYENINPAIQMATAFGNKG